MMILAFIHGTKVVFFSVRSSQKTNYFRSVLILDGFVALVD